MKNNFEEYSRKSIFSKLKEYCYFAKENDYIEITEWYNGEGFDIDVNASTEQKFQLTWGQFQLIKKLIKQLEK